ncbi:hypothetical protein AL036_05700 [Salipiger aestuarii]|uniref:Uncharacterized protein n=1 Tax=Salipiger aestuarii TaxID=568098 RepID=A0A327YIV7_9RHOB|nr:hypothetical protein [Salipiger aestuarii]EIE50838.1 hypothetical protein C357_11864 [Citreicella sp. 357]KAA8608902.1 hypothetical protein AL036_05700 [Salipiger aestuarii]KAA8613207.1 hypothetical protein AL037_05665 [Salipiger aestuarii]KAB2543041.1 hypothetical protein AL035_04090 [Salipiger aestuarii]RAK19695.1 hypothetical protein ATI53_100877 [Salipiger aestuarii]
MTGQNDTQAAGDTGGAEAARLREDIDAGATGEKVAFSDPAAAPLGTDAEAGGTPTSAAAMATARKAESAAQAAHHPKKTPAQLQRTARPGIVSMVVLGGALLFGLVLLWAGM